MEEARLFVAAMPTAEVLDAVAALPRADGTGVRWTTRGQWHVTLRFFGSAPIDEVRAAFARVSARAAVATAGPGVALLGSRVVQLPVRGLEELAAAVAVATQDLGEPPDPRPFQGHLTLARLRRGASCALVGTPFAAAFPVRELYLMRSELLRGGARHSELGRLDLRS